MSEYASRRTVTAKVNGQMSTMEVDVSLTLADLLRDELGLTGTKVSCELQVCGACSVLVDDRPVSACSFLAVDCEGSEIRTVEGLARDGRLHPVQQAFVDQFALQCGFCTPGFVMMSVALLESTPSPTREELMEYLDGNMCRCTGYRPIIEAVEAASRSAGEGDR